MPFHLVTYHHLINFLKNFLQNNKYEVAQGFDQEAATVLLAKIAINMGNKEERIEVLRWIDKSLIHLTSRFGEYTKDDPNSFKLTSLMLDLKEGLFEAPGINDVGVNSPTTTAVISV